VIAAGAAGVAIGARFPHPVAGVLGALVLFLSSGQSHLPWAAGAWLYPWASFSDQFPVLPGPLAGYPPAAAHAVELAGLAALAGIVALAVTVRGARARGWLAAAGIVAVAVTCLAGAVQLPPIPTPHLNPLVTPLAHAPPPAATTGRARGLPRPRRTAARPPAGAGTASPPASAASFPRWRRRATACSRPCPPGPPSR